MTLKKYEAIPTSSSSSPTYKDFVTYMTETVFNNQNMFTPSQGEAILDKQEETLNQLVGRMPPYPPSRFNQSGSASWDDDDDSDRFQPEVRRKGSVHVLWHNVTSAEEWLGAIQSLSLPHFSAMLGMILLFLLLIYS